MNLSFEDATIDDLPIIVDIYNSTVAGRMVTADTTIVSVESKIPWFEEHSADRRPLWVIKNEDRRIIGWASYQDFYGRPAYNGTAEISIYLHPDHRGKGLGKQVLYYCMEQAGRLGITTLLGYIFAHNEPSIKLFQKAGFEQWAFLPDIAELDGIKRSVVILGKKV
jgi:L-amino acid N-acyltransferase YncA